MFAFLFLSHFSDLSRSEIAKANPKIIPESWQNLKPKTTYGDLVLDTGDVEERLDFLPQFVPGPGPQLEVLPQVPLAHLEGQTLFLQFLELFPGQVTSDPGLHPGDDFAQTFVTQFFHLTQDSGTEEYLLFVWGEESVKPNLVWTGRKALLW